MNDDTGALKAQYYGGDGSYTEPSSSSGSSGGNFLSTVGSVLSLVNPVLGVVGNVLGGIFGSKSQSKANAQNIAMQRETNALQYRMFNEANAFTKEMWNETNAYNTPEQQAARLKAAGINPAFVFGNGSVSEAGQISSQSSPSLTAPHVDPYNPVPAASTAVDAFLQSQMNNATIKNMHENERHLEIQNELDAMQLFDKVRSMRIDNKHKNALYDLLMATYGDQKEAVRKNNAVLDAQSDNLLAQSAALKIHSYLEQKQVASQLRLNDRQMWQISQVVAQNWRQIQQEAERIGIERMSVEAQNAFLGNQAIHLINQDAAAFESIGIDKELLSSKKFSNYVGGTIGVALGSILGGFTRNAGNIGRTVVKGFGF